MAKKSRLKEVVETVESWVGMGPKAKKKTAKPAAPKKAKKAKKKTAKPAAPKKTQKTAAKKAAKKTTKAGKKKKR